MQMVMILSEAITMPRGSVVKILESPLDSFSGTSTRISVQLSSNSIRERSSSSSAALR